MSKFSKGYVPSARPARFAFADHPAASATPGTGRDLTPFAPPVMDQGGTGSCTGHGLACAIYTAFAAAGQSLPFVPSPRGLYCVGRAVTRSVGGGDVTAPLTDDGAQPSDVVVGAEQFGIRPMNAPTSDGRLSDCEPANINAEPTLEELEQDALKIAVQDHAITSVGAERIADICRAIDAGFVVNVGTQVDQAFEDYGPGSPPVSAPDMSSLLGGHDLSIIGYRRSADGSVTGIGQNSWDKFQWGHAGRFEADESWLTNETMTEVTAIVPVLGAK